ncbi:MAG: hypothetical protein M1449_00220 [Candidatus Thermoplasmatota archaeon]|nr:hypothetical protein [Candidatus Thermoplasmatota archaeon]
MGVDGFGFHRLVVVASRATASAAPGQCTLPWYRPDAELAGDIAQLLVVFKHRTFLEPNPGELQRLIAAFALEVGRRQEIAQAVAGTFGEVILPSVARNRPAAPTEKYASPRRKAVVPARLSSTAGEIRPSSITTLSIVVEDHPGFERVLALQRQTGRRWGTPGNLRADSNKPSRPIPPPRRDRFGEPVGKRCSSAAGEVNGEGAGTCGSDTTDANPVWCHPAVSPGHSVF